MKCAASKPLTHFPVDLTVAAEDVVLLTSHEEESFLVGYSNDLVPVWRNRLDTKPLALVNAHGASWVLDRVGIWMFGQEGAALARVRPGPRPGMHVSAVAPVADGFVFAWEHDASGMRPPVLERMTLEGAELWSVTLPTEPIAYERVAAMNSATGWKPRPLDPWVPETWLSTSRQLRVSGDTVLACYTEMPRSGIGFGYGISLKDGSLRFTTPKGPIQEVASLGDGTFLVGYQGYGAFETLRYDSEGRTLDRWSSHGYYLTGDDLRVIELENSLPSKMHLVRLLPGGTVEKGPWLDSYYTSPPYRGSDGTDYFVRRGVVQSVRGLLLQERLELTPSADRFVSTRMVGSDRSLYCAYWEAYLREGKKGFDTRLVRIDL